VNYSELVEFITVKMRMSHIYQPAMLIELLQNGGELHEREIAAGLLSRDQSQLEYYTKITNSMVGKILRKHQIVERDAKKKTYRLLGFSNISAAEVDELTVLAKKRLADYIERRGSNVYSHRRKSTGYISGTIRYEVLKRARFRCELCGISADEKALEVDHIKPRNKGGSDDISNLQALCYSCNAMKRDRDDTDFRGLAAEYEYRQPNCDFCELPTKRVIAENELALAIEDAYPVTDGHTLIIPKRHVADYFDLGQAEINAVISLLKARRGKLLAADASIKGFNSGTNSGAVAGQTVFHCHIHLIPRREGDTKQPVGGIRNVIEGMGAYR
jgi:diadenosine tetraphosphate (Ap4A) HIT family hydrolase